jgi:transposase
MSDCLEIGFRGKKAGRGGADCGCFHRNLYDAGAAYMHIRTLLNQFCEHPGFVFHDEHLEELEGTRALVVEVRPRKGSKAICSACGKSAPGYDKLAARLFQFVPFWGFIVFFRYSMRRVQCPTCGVKVEKVPWAEGKSPVTTMFAWFIAHWAKYLSWSETGRQFGVSWKRVFQCVEQAVEWGRAHMSLEGITAIGVDEIARAKGHQYVTLVYQIDAGCRRLLYVAKDRKEESLREFFTWFTDKRSMLLKFVCSDMWKPFLKVIKEHAPAAVQILDRFHIMTHFSKAIDEVRAGEAKALAQRGKGEILKKSRWALLKRPENLTENQTIKLRQLVAYNLKTMKAYLLKEQFQQLWEYSSPGWAARFLKQWAFLAMRSKIEPIKRVAKMVRKHQPLILNWFKAKGEISNGAVEGMNGKGRVVTKRAFGFRTFRCLEVALYHDLGRLPERIFTHRFW